jgi:hypothetical protein
MTDRLPSFYWDTCMFLEKIRREPVDPKLARAREEILDGNKKGENLIVTSVITHGLHPVLLTAA